MAKVMTTKAGTVRDTELNRNNCKIVTDHLSRSVFANPNVIENKTIVVEDSVFNTENEKIGSQGIRIAGDGRFRIDVDDEGLKKELRLRW